MVGTADYRYEFIGIPLNKKRILKWCFIIFLLLILLGSFVIIPAGYRGVLLTLGKPSMDSMGEGFHLKLPIIQKVVKMEVRTQKYEADASAASKDLQVVTSKIATNFHLTPESVPSLFREVGLNYQARIIQPFEQEIVKSTTAKFTAEELITKREEVRIEIRQALYDRLIARGIIVEDVSITNFDFSPSFNQAIEAKVTAEQLKLKAERDLERIRVEAEQTITKAQAEAEALRLQKQEITPDLIKLRQIEVQRAALDKWDGKLPQVTGGAIPFFNVGNIGNEDPIVN